MPRYDVEGRHVIVTGGANGIGMNTALRLAAKGAKVSLIDRDADALQVAATEMGDHVEPFVADVTDLDSINGAIDAARKRFGKVDVAVAAAGISGTPKRALDTSHDEFERVIDINVIGVWRTLKAVLPDVVERGGYLLPIASLAAAVPTPLLAAYGVSKHGVHSLGRTLRFELAHTGAKVGVAYFSLIETNMVRDALANDNVQLGMRSIPGPLGKPVPVSVAADAMVRGVENRAKRVCIPRWVSMVVSLHGLGGPLEALVARDPRARKLFLSPPVGAEDGAKEEVSS